ncbi:MAG: hypothetical protein FWD17_19525 [Polyangiaceae bacterium]|nr:hypothetical protein [Polyangiaceae bacterium]
MKRFWVTFSCLFFAIGCGSQSPDENTGQAQSAQQAKGSEKLVITRATWNERPASRELVVDATDSDATVTLTLTVTQPSTSATLGTLTNDNDGTYSGFFHVYPRPLSVTVTSSNGATAESTVTVLYGR